MTVTAGGPTALVPRDLHETLLSTAADGVRVARALLHGNGGNKDRGNFRILSVRHSNKIIRDRR